ncbi:uncharacterized protein NFIA_095950 [Aspergillus fischeri NRRL 181]|uniref:Major facilitator superfamily (MFS) profile domain-containing protein n=1 Tax=Neosartorya fischeri (strain ATCC 1020 / DSM 3700 / CBS 544.65 / FGSC A1164 / JCM 1740 / NRRL 181 / WB 181) TaxID=331117 RepID=A1DAT5_NEOFI|nr:uncharacterized protein NFIA_095950 [Aspergillus fischeri NRRL 181]EAW19975.1 hypothetical protein NFIA_095950 [Aspergillus fischeri NRRL 181]
MGGLVNQTAFNDTFDSPDSTMIGVIVSLMEIGAFLGSVSSAFFGERIGRRKSIAVGVVILILGALLQATAYHRSHLIVGRVVSGVGLGVVNSTVPVMQVEFSPKATRGLYVCMQLSTVHFGILVADWIDYGSSTHTGSYAWRVPVILQCTFPFLMLFFVFLMDETAPWFAAHNRQDQDLQVLRQLYNDNMHESDITALHEGIPRKLLSKKRWAQGRGRTFCGMMRYRAKDGFSLLTRYLFSNRLVESMQLYTTLRPCSRSRWDSQNTCRP